MRYILREAKIDGLSIPVDIEKQEGKIIFRQQLCELRNNNDVTEMK